MHAKSKTFKIYAVDVRNKGGIILVDPLRSSPPLLRLEERLKEEGERTTERLTGGKSSPALNLNKQNKKIRANSLRISFSFSASSSPTLSCLFSPPGPLPFLPSPTLSLTLSLLGCFEDRVVSEDLAELVEAMLHLGNAGQLGLQPLLLLGEGEARRRVQLLEAPASLAVELQQVGVVLPGGRRGRI